MAIEASFNFITDLDANYPLFNDGLVEADDHMRGIKSSLAGSFLNFVGIAMTATEAELNTLDGILASTSELNLLQGKSLASADNVLDNFPAGTLMMFQQTAAPSGWTKEVTHNDKALRVVSGTPGSGGSSPFSTVFGKSATDSFTLLEAHIPAHNHGGGSHRHSLTMYPGADSAGISVGSNNVRINPQTMNAGDMGLSGNIITSFGGSGGHAHNMDIRVNYVDIIIASKD